MRRSSASPVTSFISRLIVSSVCAFALADLDRQQLEEVPVAVGGSGAGALGAIEQAVRDVEAHRARTRRRARRRVGGAQPGGIDERRDVRGETSRVPRRVARVSAEERDGRVGHAANFEAVGDRESLGLDARSRRLRRSRGAPDSREKRGHRLDEVTGTLVVRQIAGMVEDRDVEVRLRGKEAARFLDRRLRCVFPPDEQGWLCEPPQRAADIEVEVSGDERRRGELRPRLVRGAEVGVDQLIGDERVVPIDAFEVIAERPLRDDAVEERGADDRRLERKARGIATSRWGLVQPHESCRLDEHERRKASRIARAEDDRVCRGQR